MKTKQKKALKRLAAKVERQAAKTVRTYAVMPDGTVEMILKS